MNRFQVADLECEDALEALKKSLDDDRVDVQRAATFAMGLVAERVVPEDMCWTYNNVTAQPAIKSTYLNLRWNVLRQAHVPNPAKATLDSKLKHSPRELMQGLSHTPRGGALPHLMLTPRQEHLYEGEEFQEALALREEKRKDGDKKRAILAIAAKIKEAIDRHDVEEVERLQVMPSHAALFACGAGADGCKSVTTAGRARAVRGGGGRRRRRRRFGRRWDAAQCQDQEPR